MWLGRLGLRGVYVLSFIMDEGGYSDKPCEVEGGFILTTLSREVTSGAKSRQFRSEWTPLGVHVCLDE